MKKHLRTINLSAIVCIMLFSAVSTAFASYNDAVLRDGKDYPVWNEGRAFPLDLAGSKLFAPRTYYERQDGTVDVARIVTVYVNGSAARYEMVDADNFRNNLTKRYSVAYGHFHGLTLPVEYRYFDSNLSRSSLSTNWYYEWTGIFPGTF